MSSTTQTCDVLIAGGGLVGLTFALMLAKESELKAKADDQFSLPRIDIVEAKDLSTSSMGNISERPDDADVRTTALSPITVDLYRRLGVWENIAETVSVMRRVVVSDASGSGETRFDENDNNGDAVGYIVSNFLLTASLLDQLRAFNHVFMHSSSRINDIAPVKNGMRVSVNEQEILADLVVASEGAFSSTRKALGIQEDVYDYEQVAVLTDIHTSNTHDNTAFEIFTTKGPLAVLPLIEENHSTVIWTQPTSIADKVAALNDDQFNEKLQKVFGARLGKIIDIGKRYQFPLSRVLAKEQVRSSFVLLGNAMHSLHPVAGQGYNLSIRDASVLVSCLMSNCKFSAYNHQRYGSLARLHAYDEARKKDQALTIKISHGFNQVFTQKNAAITHLRNLGLSSVGLLGPAKKEFFAAMMGRTHPQALLRINGHVDHASSIPLKNTRPVSS